MQRVLAKERASQSKALDLQSQLGRAKTEQSQLQRSKEEVRQNMYSIFKIGRMCLSTVSTVSSFEVLYLGMSISPLPYTSTLI